MKNDTCIDNYNKIITHSAVITSEHIDILTDMINSETLDSEESIFRAAALDAAIRSMVEDYSRTVLEEKQKNCFANKCMQCSNERRENLKQIAVAAITGFVIGILSSLFKTFILHI